jgi:hypothetical protein
LEGLKIMGKSLRILVTIHLFSVLIVACGKVNTTASPKSIYSANAFLAVSDISKSSKVNTIVKANLDSEMKGVTSFYDDNPTTAGDADCISKLMNKLTIKSYGSYIGVGAEVDITSCISDFLNDPDIKGAPSSLRIAFQGGCDNEDFSKLDGKTFEEFEKMDSNGCLNATKLTELLNVKMTMAATGSKFGQSISLEFVSYLATATANMQPCTATVSNGVATYADGCLRTDRNVQSTYKINGTPSPLEGTEDFSQLESSSIVQAKGDNTWYQSGKMKTTLNNWTGDVTYRGTTTAPTYNMGNGSETATGSLSSTRTVASPSIVNQITQYTLDRMVKTAAIFEQVGTKLETPD